MSADIGTVLLKLDAYAAELDACSRKLAAVEEELEPLEVAYNEAMDDLEAMYWNAHENDDAKLPPQHMREALSRKSLRSAFSHERALFLSKRKRLEKRIRTLAELVDAQRSILSALKSEMEAIR